MLLDHEIREQGFPLQSCIRELSTCTVTWTPPPIGIPPRLRITMQSACMPLISLAQTKLPNGQSAASTCAAFPKQDMHPVY